MYIKVERPDKDGKKIFSNKGTCQGYVTYLCKEDKEKDYGMELFFNHERDDVSPGEVVKAVDRNWRNLNKNDAKFYSVIIAPQDKELEHLGGNKKKLKEYARQVMDVYARNFNSMNGKNKGLKGSDLTYFCKLEDHRYYKGWEKEVIQGLAKKGKKKPGKGHVHIHIIVSRKDRQNRYTLSPRVNAKRIFHVEGFKLKSGYLFDKMFHYRGSVNHLEAHMFKRTGTLKEVEMYASYKPGPMRHPIMNLEPELPASQQVPKRYLKTDHKQEKDLGRHNMGHSLGL
jgi:hypothetical protein